MEFNMKATALLAPLLCLALPLQAEKNPPAPEAVLFFSVNGVEVTPDMVRYAAREKMKSGQAASPEMQRQLLNEITTMILLSNEAEKEKLGEKSPHLGALKMQRINYLANAQLEKIAKSSAPTEADLKALFEKQFAQPKQEYKARHILLKDKEKAEKLLAELKKGADFAELAKRHSTGPTGPKGGDLGWFTLDRMVKPFGDAVAALKKGEYSQAPVKTQFGWHLILQEDSRTLSPPKYETLVPQLKAEAQRQLMRDYIGKLQKTAEIKATPKNQPKKP
jgi:peptidyl-prolyl cis-trans isomerase C